MSTTKLVFKFRSQMQAEVLLDELERITVMLLSGYETRRNLATRQMEAWPLTSERVSALSKAADAHLKLLAKVLPDLKAVELEALASVDKRTRKELLASIAALMDD